MVSSKAQTDEELERELHARAEKIEALSKIEAALRLEHKTVREELDGLLRERDVIRGLLHDRRAERVQKAGRP